MYEFDYYSYPHPLAGLVFLLLAASIVMVPVWRILRKAGYSGAWSILVFIPMLNLVLLWVFAFSSWPLERQANSGGGQDKTPEVVRR